MLGVLFRIREQLVLERDVVLGRRAARPRAGDRAQRSRAARQPHQRLGRGARDAQVAELEEVHVRGGIQEPQAAIGLERVEVGAAGETHGQHDLVDVAGFDVRLALQHRRRVLGLRHARGGFREFAGPRRCVEPAAQRLNDGRAQRLTVALAARMQQRDAAREVIEHEQRLGRDVHGLRQAGELFGVRRKPFEEAHDVIARRADEPAVERDAVDLRLQERRARHGAAHHRLPFAGVRRPALGLAVDREPVGVELDGHGLAETDERVACEPLAALDALQQESRLERLQLHVRRYRGIEIGGDVER